MVYLSRWGSKYGNKSTVYNGRSYMSKYEAKVANELDLRKMAGEFVEVVPQYRIKLYCYVPNGDKVHLFDYICDFRCEKPDGSYLLVEAKGHATEVYKTKRKLLDLVWLPDHLDYSFEEVRQRTL